MFDRWQSLPQHKKISLAALLLLIVAATLALIVWLCLPHYGTLFNQLDSEDARQMIRQLDQKQIPYTLSQGGTSILVAENQVDKLRLELMGNGLKLAGNVGFELFDRSDFGMTDFSQKINYQRALQGELERTISSLTEIKSARVHLVMPEKLLFGPSTPPSASITLHVASAQQLRRRQIDSIQQLVAASVPHLSAAQVIILDERGRTLSDRKADSTDGQLRAKKNMEHYLENKAQRLLQSVFPNQAVRLQIDVTLNHDHSERNSESYLPTNDAVLTHSKEVQHVKGNKKTQEVQDISSEKSYQYGRLVEKQHLASGAIKQLTVSVVVPQDSDMPMQNRIGQMVKTAIGFSEARGDSISVQALLLSPPALSTHNEPAPAPMAKPDPPLNRHAYQALLALGLILLLMLGKLLLDNRRRQRLLQEIFAGLEQPDASI
ncbi:MAG: flagellar M-ring protein FliF [Legionellaceae bacterium]|nr:flagellar M-ring protein FliF [Legionellaceae bacterium]